MVVQALIFYVFSVVTVASGFFVITSKNPVHSVLFLILTFFNAAGLFVLLHAEFLAMILVVVYVGAVAVLFLFVVMMLNINLAEIKQGFLQYLPIGLLLGIVLISELIILFGGINAQSVDLPRELPFENFDMMTNTHAIGQVLYTQYIYVFQIAGLILLLAMIGAIVLTLRERPGVIKQSVKDQLSRKPKDTLEIVDVPSRKGV